LEFYATDDPALFVPKRIGIGQTLNFGRPGAWIFLAAIAPPRPGAPADIAHRVSSR
jgi:hypothetical protein